jgi:putative molybdopterin biosynthesis protein
MIRGYDHEEFTHLAIAASIGSGRSDAGLGIASAAKALGLDFVPLYQEQYDLIFPKEFFKDELLSSVRKAMSDLEFRRTVRALDGYNVDNMGEIVFDQ